MNYEIHTRQKEKLVRNEFKGIGKYGMPLIKSQDIDWNDYDYIKNNHKMLFYIEKNDHYYLEPQILSIDIDNYQGTIKIVSDNTNKIEWYVDNNKIRTKYNTIGKFLTTLNVQNLEGKELTFALFGEGGKTLSKTFVLLPQEVL